MEVHPDVVPPYVVVASRDAPVKVVLLDDVRPCRWRRAWKKR